MPGKKAHSLAATDWPAEIHRALKSQRVRQVSYVPDAGHKRLIELCQADKAMRAVVLSTEEEGIGLAAGAWLGGEKSALLAPFRQSRYGEGMLHPVSTSPFPWS